VFRATSDDGIPGLFEKIRDKSAEICIVGLGYVGLPLAVAFAEAGFKTLGVDSDRSKIECINQGQTHIRDGHVEVKLPELAVRGGLTASADLESSVRRADFVILCLPTPIDDRRRPDLRIIRGGLAKISSVLTPGKFIVIESSVYPGFTQEVAKPILEESGLKAGSDFGLAYSPERIDFGNRQHYLTEINKVVGGINATCTDIAAELYNCILRAGVTEVSSPSVAEGAKMLENIYRFVNISLVNELAVLFEAMNIDTFEVVRAAATKPFGFQPHFPGPGIGGHCIPKDPYYLEFKARQRGTSLKILSASARIDSGMASHVCRGVRLALRQLGKKMKGSRITVLGLSYKGETDEIRRTPAIGVISGMSRMGARVRVYDPYVPEITAGHKTYRSQKTIDDAFLGSDCCAFLVDHKAFQGLDFDLLCQNAAPPPFVYDARGIFNGPELALRGICYAGLGRSPILSRGIWPKT
jgi:UDP-N-acetyl-D-glucosamine dehydrogenase